MTEQWRPIPDWERYEVSDQGRVRNRRGQRLSVWVGTRGYLRVRLHQAGSARNLAVHRLVLSAFVGPCPPGMEGCHENGDRSNCSLGNLRWDTPSSNAHDRVRHGTHAMAARTTCPRKHPLVEPNLVVATAKEGHRACKACNRAHANVRKAKLRGEPYDFETWADDHFQRIMSASSA
jgi:hypothetical protein